MSRTLIENEIFNFTTMAMPVLVCGGFRRALEGPPYDHAMIRQGGAFLADQRAWSEDEWGRWQGAPAPPSMVKNLAIDGAEPIARDAASERDTILRLETGEGLVARWGLTYHAQATGNI